MALSVRLVFVHDVAMTTQHITVGFDGSEPSKEAVLWAADEATLRGDGLRIVSCYQLPVMGEAAYGWMTTEGFAAMMADTAEMLGSISDVVAGSHPDLDISTRACSGPAGLALAEESKTSSLVVVGASKHEGKAAFWLGSTPRHVVRHSECPVVAVRGAASRGRADRIVVGYDGSPESDQAIEWGGTEADRQGIGLTVVHCWFYPYLAVGETWAQRRDLTQVDAALLLDRAVERANERFGAAVVGQLVEGSPSTGLLDAVRDGDLLVLGSRGAGALRSGLFGSTVNSVLDHAAVPVVVVRGADVAD